MERENSNNGSKEKRWFEEKEEEVTFFQQKERERESVPFFLRQRLAARVAAPAGQNQRQAQ
jgi:hypothetical protein